MMWTRVSLSLTLSLSTLFTYPFLVLVPFSGIILSRSQKGYWKIPGLYAFLFSSTVKVSHYSKSRSWVMSLFGQTYIILEPTIIPSLMWYADSLKPIRIYFYNLRYGQTYSYYIARKCWQQFKKGKGQMDAEKESMVGKLYHIAVWTVENSV